MVEIALCLAIIGFALVAIIGVLPMGMSVQTKNRQETIIDEDAVVWMDALRNGARQYDNIASYVLWITNYWSTYSIVNGTNMTLVRSNQFDWYGRTNSQVEGFPISAFALTNGFRIVGLLSMPRMTSPPPFGRGGTVQSNYLVAYVRGMSGPAVEKPPQDNPEILANVFTYRMIVENVDYLPQDPESINFASVTNVAEILARRNNAQRTRTLQNNSHDLRLTFRWPVLPNGETGNERQTFRIFTGGTVARLSDDDYVPSQPLYFLQPTIYTNLPPLP
jgi:hypothetical protein